MVAALQPVAAAASRKAAGADVPARRDVVNRWNIPDALEREIIDRDRCCAYCRVDFTAPSASRSTRPSWEHIINDASIVTRENIVRSCVACNSSKGTKCLNEWLNSSYCRTRGITRESVAAVVRVALQQADEVSLPAG
jgi:hypothetical protein